MIQSGKKRVRIVCLFIAFAAILAAIFGGLTLYKKLADRAERAAYPLGYSELVEKYSAEYSLDPILVYAVIRTESRFKPDAESHAGAHGLMQITTDTFFWLEARMGIDISDDLTEPETNIMLGTYYLSYLTERFGDTDTALAAYNAGPSRVFGWLEDPEYSDNGQLTEIPIDETDNYVKSVNAAYAVYKRLYFQEEN